MIRKATVADVEAIHRILKEHADRGELLPRALSDLYDDLRDFSLFQDEHGGPIIGVCALHVCWEDLAEIRSLAVSEQHQGGGIGSELVAAALAEAQDLGIRRVFTLTYQPDFFNKYGFKIVEKAALPQKVWTECIKCVKFPDCDEVAMLKQLSSEQAR
ncbi:MAG: N-acetyltransferase [Desulfobacteria bacterium]